MLYSVRTDVRTFKCLFPFPTSGFAPVNPVLICGFPQVLNIIKLRSVRNVEIQVHLELSSLSKHNARFEDRAVLSVVRTTVRTVTHLLESFKEVREEHQ